MEQYKASQLKLDIRRHVPREIALTVSQSKTMKERGACLAGVFTISAFGREKLFLPLYAVSRELRVKG
jgi:hypothetical protein